MDFFCAEEYIKLEQAVRSSALSGDKDALEDLGFLKKALISFAGYVFAVDEERIEVRFAQGILKGAELQSVVAHFDSTRHAAHEQAIVNVKMINRIAAAYGVGNVFVGDPQNRREIGHFCGEIGNWIFVNRYN